MQSHASGTGAQRAGDVAKEEEDPMFVIKNLDTGLQIRIDDFDRLAHIAADPDPAVQESPAGHRKASLLKGTKALKQWTQTQAKKASATAKKAVSHVKEVAHELNVQQVLPKHKLHLDAAQSGGGAEAEQHAGDVPRPLLALLRRPTVEAATGSSHADDRPKAASLASTSIAASEASLTSQDSGKQPHLPAAATAASSSSGGAATAHSSGGTTIAHNEHTGLAPAASMTAAAAPPPYSYLSNASVHSLTPRSDLSASTPTAAAAAAAVAATASPAATSTATTAAAAAAVAQRQPVVPASVRLVSHKTSKRPYEAVVLAQVLECGSGVVWALAVSPDGAFLAAAGQDCLVRIWQMTSSRSKHTRSDWVHNSSSTAAGTDFKSTQQQSDAGSSSSQPEQQQQQQQQQQWHKAAGQEGQHQPTTGPQGATLQPDLSAVTGDSSQQQQQQQPCQEGRPPDPDPQAHAARTTEFGPYYSRNPVRQYSGHMEDVLDLSWSCSGGFLLSASLDKTVRLWHLSQPGCLRRFDHSDFVTSAQFHPTDAQRFVSGSLDGKIRVWSVVDGTVLAAVQLHQDMVTAVCFSLSGTRVMAGTMRGRMRFYDLADGKLEYVAQVDVRNQRGQHASGKKVTSIQAVPGHPQQFLITTNDSRLRLIEGYGQVLKYKGHRNSSTQARAAVSPDGVQLACGSDDGCLYLWQRTPGGAASSGGSAGDAGSSGRTAGQQRGGGGGSGMGSGGGGDRPRSMAAAAAAQYQQLMSKNASYQAFQAHEPGMPVPAVAFLPQAMEGLPKFSVMVGQGSAAASAAGAAGAGAAGQSTGAAAAAAAAEAAFWDTRKCFVQQLLVSGGFDGSLRVHELLSGPSTTRSKSTA